MTTLRIGNASGFYGDRFDAMREMLTGGELDVLTGDYLAELTMLILGRDRLKDPSAGYARTFLRQLEECLGLAQERGVKIVAEGIVGSLEYKVIEATKGAPGLLEFKACRDANNAFLAGLSRWESAEAFKAALPTITSLSPLRKPEWSTRPDELITLVEL